MIARIRQAVALVAGSSLAIAASELSSAVVLPYVFEYLNLAPATWPAYLSRAR